MSRKSKRSSQRQQFMSQFDPDDFMDMEARSTRKEKRRAVRKNNKQNLRDAVLDPETLDEYMDDIKK